MTAIDLTELEYTVNHISVRPILAEWAEAVDIDLNAVEVLERGTQIDVDGKSVVGWVRFTLMDATFVAHFAPDRVTTAWLETGEGDNPRHLYGPVSDWNSLQMAAQQAEARSA